MKTITNIVYNFVRNQLAKSNMGQGKGITSLPNAADIEIGMTEIYNLLRKGGFDAVSAGKDRDWETILLLANWLRTKL